MNLPCAAGEPVVGRAARVPEIALLCDGVEGNRAIEVGVADPGRRYSQLHRNNLAVCVRRTRHEVAEQGLNLRTQLATIGGRRAGGHCAEIEGRHPQPIARLERQLPTRLDQRERIRAWTLVDGHRRRTHRSGV